MRRMRHRRQKETAPQSDGNGQNGGNSKFTNNPNIILSVTDESGKYAAAVIVSAADGAAYRTALSLVLLGRVATALLAESEVV